MSYYGSIHPPMRTEDCQCGQTLFYDDTQCPSCHCPVGHCAECGKISGLIGLPDGGYACQHADCPARLVLCHNYAIWNVCNGTVSVTSDDPYCDSCQLTEILPDLSRPEMHERWFQMEAAKRRLLYSLDLLKLPYRRSDPEADPPLRFQFLEDTDSQVMTTHQDGWIMIHLAEADLAGSEKARGIAGEPRRTIIRHFRHEIGHYYRLVLVQNRNDEPFRDVFGDESTLPYAEAQERYSQEGPRPDWQEEYISAYATMHPWEDFAESFAGYLDMVSLLDTAEHQHVVEAVPEDFPEMTVIYQDLAVAINEFSRDRGLADRLPQGFTAKVAEKLAYVHDLVHNNATRSS